MTRVATPCFHQVRCQKNADTSLSPRRLCQDRRRRGHRAARVGGQGATRELAGRRRHGGLHRNRRRRRGADSRGRQRGRHRGRRGGAGVPAARHQQGVFDAGPGDDLDPRFPGRGPPQHRRRLQRVPGQQDGFGRVRHSGGRGGGRGRRRPSRGRRAGHVRDGPPPVQELPRAPQVPADQRYRGVAYSEPGDPLRAGVPPGQVPAVDRRLDRLLDLRLRRPERGHRRRVQSRG